MADPRPAWRNSTRASRLPPNWFSVIRPAVFRRDGRICHVCGQDGADDVDHLRAGDDHALDNLAPIHSWRTPQRCHAKKSAAEGAAASIRRRRFRPPEPHPGLA